MKPARVVIKKYANRRLYDTSASRYVNLEDIAAMIRNGTDVQIVDAKSGGDLTRVTLTQIIMENAKDHPAGMPLELLQQLIMASDQVRQEFMTWYLKSAFDTYRKVQSALHNGFTEVRSAALSPLEMMKNFIQGAAPEKPAENGELQQLRKRIAELEARLETPKRPKRSRAGR
jgi:polyhydroxyalkanoate synthesis repressor PhaR